MKIVPWRNKKDEVRELAPVTRFRDEMESMFDRLFNVGLSPFEGWPARGFGWPRVDLAETENEVCVKAELPGVDPKEVEVKVEGNLLTLQGEKKQEKEEKRKDYQYVERQYGSFQRTIQLPSSIDPEKVDASFKDGGLTVTIAKRADAKPKKITVRGG